MALPTLPIVGSGQPMIVAKLLLNGGTGGNSVTTNLDKTFTSSDNASLAALQPGMIVGWAWDTPDSGLSIGNVYVSAAGTLKIRFTGTGTITGTGTFLMATV